MSETISYSAFISYSHADVRWAKWLHRRLERYRTPHRLIGTPGAHGPVPPRIGRCFRDQAELSASSHLGENLKQALRQSAALVVVCSPRAAASAWVNEEIKYFLSLGRGEHIYTLIVDGEPQAGPECFPPALLQSDDGRPRLEPLAADVRHTSSGRGDGFLKLAAGLLGVGFDALRRREHHRQLRIMAFGVAASLLVASLTTVLAVSAYRARNLAQQQQQRAERIKNYVVSIFAEQNPFSRGSVETQTPQQLLAAAAARLDGELASEPELRTELLTDIGGIQIDLGDLGNAGTLLERALGEQRQRYGGNSLATARTLSALARLRTIQTRVNEAEAMGREALGVLLQHPDADSLDIARAEHTLALAMSFGKGAPVEAVAMMSDALQRFEGGLGKDSPAALGSLFSLGQLHEQSRDDALAETELREVIARAERRYGSDTVLLTTPLPSLAQVLARAGHVDEAEALYRRSLAILHRQLGPRGAGQAQALKSLGTLLRNQRRLHEAKRVLIDAEAALVDGDEANRADILRARGRIEILLGEADTAEKDLHGAYALRLGSLGESNAFTWYFASEWGRGLAALGKFSQAEAIQRKALEHLTKLMGPQAMQVSYLLDSLALTLERQPDRRQDAETLRRQQLQVIEGKYPKTHLQWANAALDLAGNLSTADSADARTEALALTVDAIAILRHNKAESQSLGEALGLQARLLAAAARSAEARGSAAESLALLQSVAEPDTQRVAETRALLQRLGG